MSGNPASVKRAPSDQDSPENSGSSLGSSKRVKNDQKSTNNFHVSLDESRLLLAKPKDQLAQFANKVRETLNFTEMADFNHILGQIQNMNRCMGLFAWVYEKYRVRIDGYRADAMLHKQGELGAAVDTSLKCEALLATLCSKLQIESNGDPQVLLSNQEIVEERIETLISLKNQIYPESINDPQLIIHKPTAQMQKQNKGDLDKRIKSLVESDSEAKAYRRHTERMLTSFIRERGFPDVTVSGDFDGKWKAVLNIFSLLERKVNMFNDVAELLGLDANWDELDLPRAERVYTPRISDLISTHTLFRQLVNLLHLSIPVQGLDVSHCEQIIAQFFASSTVYDNNRIATAQATYETVLQKNADFLKDNQAKAAAMDRMEKTASDRAAAKLRQDPSPERTGTNMVSTAYTEKVAEFQAMLRRFEEADLAKSKEIARLRARLEAGKEEVDLLNADEVTTFRREEQAEHARIINVLEGQLSVRSEELGELKKTTTDQLKEKENTILELQNKSKEDKRNYHADVEELNVERTVERTEATAKVEGLTSDLAQERLNFINSKNEIKDLLVQLEKRDERIKQLRSSHRSLPIGLGDDDRNLNESYQRNEELEVEVRDLRAEHSEQAGQARKDRDAVNQLYPVVHILTDQSSSIVQEGNDGLQALKKVPDLERRLESARKEISDHKTQNEQMAETIRKLRASTDNDPQKKRLQDAIRKLNTDIEWEATRRGKIAEEWARNVTSQRDVIAELEADKKDLEEKVKGYKFRLQHNLIEYYASADKKAAAEAEAEVSELRRQLMKSDDKSDELKDRIADFERSVQKHTHQLRESDSKLVDLHKAKESQAVDLTAWEAKANELDNEIRKVNSSSQAIIAELTSTKQALREAVERREQPEEALAPRRSSDTPLPIHDDSQAESVSMMDYLESAVYGPDGDLEAPFTYTTPNISIVWGGFASLLARTGNFFALVFWSLIQAMRLIADSMVVDMDRREDVRGTDSNDGLPRFHLTQLTKVMSSIGTGVSTAFESMWHATVSVADSMMIDYDGMVDCTDSAAPMAANVPALATIIFIVLLMFIVLSIPLLPSNFGLRPAQVATEPGGDMLRRIQISIRQGGGSGQWIPRWFWDDPLLDPMPGLYGI